MNNLECPVCSSSDIQTERRLDGFHHCMNCWNSWKIGESQPKPTDCVGKDIGVLARESEVRDE